MDLQELCNRAEITDLITGYTRPIDTGDRARLVTVFTRDARIDYTSWGGIAGGLATVRDWLAKVLPALPHRQHAICQIDFRLDGDRAEAIAYFLNPMTTLAEDGSEGLYRCGGLYHHKLIRTPDGWRSRELFEETVWTAA